MDFDHTLEDYLNANKGDLDNLLLIRDVLGEGASGTAVSADVKPRGKYPTVVLKELNNKRYGTNEKNALKLITKLQKQGKLSNYFINLYADVNSGHNCYLVLEKADIRFDELFTPRNGTTKEFLNIFWQLSQAVKELEAIQMNHGDLWVENVMLTKVGDRYHVRIIDFDCAFKERSNINKPALGGAFYYRSKFILGYDLNRFFDSLLYSYRKYVVKKLADKKRRIAKATMMRKRGKKVTVPKLDVEDSEDEEWDQENIMYPPEIIEFMESLGTCDPEQEEGQSVKEITAESDDEIDEYETEGEEDEDDVEYETEGDEEDEGEIEEDDEETEEEDIEEEGVPICFTDMPHLSGESVQKKIEELAEKLNITLYKK